MNTKYSIKSYELKTVIEMIRKWRLAYHKYETVEGKAFYNTTIIGDSSHYTCTGRG